MTNAVLPESYVLARGPTGRERAERYPSWRQGKRETLAASVRSAMVEQASTD